MMTARNIETALARLTLALLVVYIPVETWASWPNVVANPFYWIDLIAMVLLFWGAVHSLRARPRAASGVLCAAYAWTAANGWRATFGRLAEIQRGGELDHGVGELWGVGAATVLALACLALALLLVVRGSVRSP
jgi:hypothetical protein